MCARGASVTEPDSGPICPLGSAAPMPRPATEAEEYLSAELESSGCWESREQPPSPVAHRFGDLVAAAASPIDDVRGSAAYRRHALAVMARRTLSWAWAQYRLEGRAEAPG